MKELKAHEASILALLAEYPSLSALQQLKGRLSTAAARKVAEALVLGTKSNDPQVNDAVKALKRWAAENKVPRRVAQTVGSRRCNLPRPMRAGVATGQPTGMRRRRKHVASRNVAG